jgi:hypothetical protein
MYLNLKDRIQAACDMAEMAERQNRITHRPERPVAIVAERHIKMTHTQLEDLTGENLDASYIGELLASALDTAEKAVTWDDKAHRRDHSDKARLTARLLEYTVERVKEVREAFVRKDQLEAA